MLEDHPCRVGFGFDASGGYADITIDNPAKRVSQALSHIDAEVEMERVGKLDRKVIANMYCDSLVYLLSFPSSQ